jgi:hypothetical protein
MPSGGQLGDRHERPSRLAELSEKVEQERRIEECGRIRGNVGEVLSEGERCTVQELHTGLGA